MVDPVCAQASVYLPALPTNNTGACIALHTPRTLPLLSTCCPSSRVYAVSTNDTTNGTVNCEYIVCELIGYDEFADAASCMARSVIVEGTIEETEVLADSKRACEFNRKGSGLSEKTNVGVRGIAKPTISLMVFVLLAATLVC